MTDQNEASGLNDKFLDLWEAASRYIAFLAAGIATAGSLFFSQVIHLIPCELCWYQRILMYPLAIILPIGIWRRDRGLAWYVLPLSISGALISTYHYLLIKTNWFTPPKCSSGVPCNVDYIDWLGFINIPFMALIAFLTVTFMTLAWLSLRPDDETEAPSPSKLGLASGFIGSLLGGGILAWMVHTTLVG